MGRPPDRDLLKAVKLVESIIRDRGGQPDKVRVSAAEGGAAWAMRFGSAAVMIALNPGVENQAARLRIASPVVKIGEARRTDLFARLLELNGSALPGAAFGVVRDEVFLVAERSIRGLDRAELEEMIAIIGLYSDKYDNLLALEFGCTRVCDLD